MKRHDIPNRPIVAIKFKHKLDLYKDGCYTDFYYKLKKLGLIHTPWKNNGSAHFKKGDCTCNFTQCQELREATK